MTTPTMAAASGTHQAFKRAARGNLPIAELFQAALTLTEAGQRPRAIELYRSWLQHTPSPLAYAARFNLAVVLGDSGDTAGAEAAYRAALEQNPRFCEAQLNLGTLLERLKRPDEALAAWRRVLDITDPAVPAEKAHRIQALNNLGRLMEIGKDFPGAEAMLTLSLRLDAAQPNVITHWVHLRQKQCKWPVYDSAASGIAEHELMASTSALAMLSGSGDPAWQLAASRRFITDKVVTDVAPLASPDGYRHGRLRVGYLSSDFCSHAVSILTAELYGLHDRARIEVYGYDWSNDDGSPLRARVLAGMDHHVRIHALTDEQAARAIRADEIDILVDLHGLTLGARPTILSYRPAPVQITWLGLPGPTGHPAIDYVIADPFVLPPELEPYFTEQPLHMPRTFQINDRQRTIGVTPTRAACGLPNDAIVFCAFNNAFKINPAMFGAWMRILQRVPDSLLWLVSDHEAVRANLLREAGLAGVDPARLLFAGRVVPADYLARYQVADLFLDTAPFNGGTTASDALWAGLPVLTCSGRTFSSRMAGSLLRAVDLPELITYTLADYEELAVALAHDRPRLAAMKRQLDQQRMTCALFDSAQFVRDLEQRFDQIAVRPAGFSADAEAEAAAGSALAAAAPRSITGGGLPLVSILIPLHEQPEYGELALQSALAQTWDNVEIVVSDSSAGEDTARRLAPYLARHSCIRYFRVPGYDLQRNRDNCYDHCQGAYFNYLVDGDLFHREKVAKMMSFMLTSPRIGLVTSFRPQPGGDAGQPLFATDVLLGGEALGDLLLHNSANLIGGASAALVRKAALDGHFGRYRGHQYAALADAATWLQVLSGHDAVYLPQALSERAAAGQAANRAADPRGIAAQFEWLQLLCDSIEQRTFQRDRGAADTLLGARLQACVAALVGARDELRAAGGRELEAIQSLLRQATELLLARPD